MVATHQDRPTHEGGGEAFSFGATDMQAQGMRNLMVMATLPWAALWALGSEMAAASLLGKDD